MGRKSRKEFKENLKTIYGDKELSDATIKNLKKIWKEHPEFITNKAKEVLKPRTSKIEQEHENLASKAKKWTPTLMKRQKVEHANLKGIRSFDKAFAAADKAGLKTFDWGKSSHTTEKDENWKEKLNPKLKENKSKDTPKKEISNKNFPKKDDKEKQKNLEDSNKKEIVLPDLNKFLVDPRLEYFAKNYNFANTYLDLIYPSNNINYNKQLFSDPRLQYSSPFFSTVREGIRRLPENVQETTLTGPINEVNNKQLADKQNLVQNLLNANLINPTLATLNRYLNLNTLNIPNGPLHLAVESIKNSLLEGIKSFWNSREPLESKPMSIGLGSTTAY